MQNQQVSDFGTILLFIVGAIVFAVVGLIAAWVIRPNRPSKEKGTTYECGEETIGNAWGNFNFRFYVVALVFILFEVELVVLFPWATVFGKEKFLNASPIWGWFSVFEAFVFIGILLLGLAYAWVKGYLEWVKPVPKKSTFKSNIPDSAYEKYK